MDGYTTDRPDEINGWSVIASAIIDQDSRLILAENYVGKGDDWRLAYVLSTAPIDNTGTGWHSGTYFEGRNARENKALAREAFADRLRTYWHL